jgi:transcription initiation factor TFIIF subunit beta
MNPPVQQETKPTYILSPEPISVENMDRKLWLVKIPRFVAEKWGNVQESGIELGKVRIYAK